VVPKVGSPCTHLVARTKTIASDAGVSLWLMNHGLIAFERDEVGAHVWRLAMEQGRFVTVYIGRSIERRMKSGEMWREAYVGSCDPPADYPGEEFGRYEPEYDQLFVRMCRTLKNTSTASVVVPRESDAKEAIGTLDALHAVSVNVLRRLALAGQRRRFSRPRVADLLRQIPIRPAWAYVLNYFYEDPCTLFLSEDAGMIHALESLNPDERQFARVETW